MLQFLFNGFTGFRWPVAFYCTRSASAHQLYLTFLEVLEAVSLHGFTVDYLCMDGALTNRSFTKMLFPQSPNACLYKAVNVFSRKKKIVILQDIKHCVKKIRNSVESSREINKESGRYLRYNGDCILWEHWEGAFKYNAKFGICLHRRLTRATST